MTREELLEALRRDYPTCSQMELVRRYGKWIPGDLRHLKRMWVGRQLKKAGVELHSCSEASRLSWAARPKKKPRLHPKYGYDLDLVASVDCLACDRAIGRKPYREVKTLARFGQMFFVHVECPRPRPKKFINVGGTSERAIELSEPVRAAASVPAPFHEFERTGNPITGAKGERAS